MNRNLTEIKYNIYVSVHWVQKDNGKVLAIMNGYTFYLRRYHPVKSTWSCTQAGKCKARLMITSEKELTDRVVVSAKLDHNHKRPNFSISNGYYTKTHNNYEYYY